MANCEKFLEMDALDQSRYMAELIHACQSDNDFFEAGQQLINSAKNMGIFNRVIMFPKSSDYINDTITKQ